MIIFKSVYFLARTPYIEKGEVAMRNILKVGVVVVLTVLVCIVSFCLVSNSGIYSESIHQIDLSYFSGSIFSEKELVWGNETHIKVPFKEIQNWNGEGFLYFAKDGWTIRLMAQRPDPKIRGLCQYAEEGISVCTPFSKIVDVRLDGKKLIAKYGPDKALLYTLEIFFLIMIAIMTACFTGRALWPSKKQNQH